MATQVASIAYDELDERGSLKQLYNFDAFVDFVGKVTKDNQKMYRLGTIYILNAHICCGLFFVWMKHVIVLYIVLTGALCVCFMSNL